ncbi:MAG: prepilin-type N-terminal cleavage/methylation domain-containing protein [Patescibacteria group bacterium]
MRKTIRGFTIVELLIVIVVIGILAAITIVAYNGISERARFTSMRSDLSQINKLVQLYYAQNGSYPITPSSGTGCSSGYWCGFDQATNDNFIPGIVPTYTSSLPQLPTVNGNNDTYIYKSPSGTDYKLVRYNGAVLSASEQAAFADMRTSGCTSPLDTDRWGYWSSTVSRCW